VAPFFIRQNNGTLSKKRRQGEFKKLHAAEVTSIERKRRRLLLPHRLVSLAGQQLAVGTDFPELFADGADLQAN